MGETLLIYLAIIPVCWYRLQWFDYCYESDVPARNDHDARVVTGGVENKF